VSRPTAPRAARRCCVVTARAPSEVSPAKVEPKCPVDTRISLDLLFALVFDMGVSADLLSDDVVSPRDAAQVAALDAVRERLVGDARSWAAQIDELTGIALRAEQGGAQVRRTLALELAGSWRIGQLTAERWLAEAERFVDALPLTLSMLRSGSLLRHQASKLLHRTNSCAPEVARAVEAEVLPAGAGLCPSDLERRIDRVRLRIESEEQDPADAERLDAQQAAGRRTFARPTEDGMALAGAVLTPEQGVAWAAGMDALERRERAADRAAGIDRTAEQRRADLFAALPSLVLAGTAQDDAFRRAAGWPTGGRVGAPRPGENGVLFDVPAGCPPWTFDPAQVAAQIVLNVHVPVSTVLELSREPGTLDRYGPVSAEHVRLLRPKSFRRVLVDALTGRPIAVDDRTTPADPDPHLARQQIRDMLTPAVVTDADEPQHDPSGRLARLIDLRDLRCCGPGCSCSRCDRDHLDPWPAGPTSAGNLGLLSPRCHSAKHSGWTLLRHPDGSVTWHSPLHRQYDRPGPWNPPPRVDLRTDPPSAPRDRPRAAAGGNDDIPLLEQLDLPPTPPPTDSPSAGCWPDDPPF
jgi:hypothetical protein